MVCKLCNDTGEQRYWEGRWRDEKAENERLRAALGALRFGLKDIAIGSGERLLMQDEMRARARSALADAEALESQANP